MYAPPVRLVMPLAVLACHPPIVTEGQAAEVQLFVAGLEQLLALGPSCASYRCVV
jgi:hypothetical protein